MKEKVKYSVIGNVGWMVKQAWVTRRRLLLFVLLSAVLAILINLIQLYIAPEVLAKVEQGVSVKELLNSIVWFITGLFLAQGFKEYIKTNTLGPKIDVRSSIVGKIMRKSNQTSYLNTLDSNFNRLHEKADEATCSNNAASEHIWETLILLLTNIGGLIIYLLIISNMDMLLLLVVILTCIFSFFVSRYTNNWRYAHKEEEEKYYQKKAYIRRTSESVSLAKDIRIFGLQPWLNELLDKVHNLYLDFSLKCERKELLADVVEIVMTMARNGIAYVYLISRCLNEGLSVSEFLLYFTAISTFTNWVMGILQQMSILHKESLEISRIREFLEYPEPFIFEDGEAIAPASEYEIKLENVSFAYPNADKDTIHHLNLVVHPKEKLAIVGLNGAGKTTLVKLLCGLLDPTEGRVLLNGEDIRKFNRRAYYDLFSAVFQDFSVLDVTVAENIALELEKEMDMDKVRECIDKAGLTSMIEKLPKGLKTHIGREVYLDGVLFSGGQTQRLMLARALYKDGPILLLDEPTAALDPIAENDIYMKYSEMTQGKTSLFISHRLASTRFCDRIIFVGDGRVLEEGTHESLLALNGEYAKLFEVQSRYYREGKEF